MYEPTNSINELMHKLTNLELDGIIVEPHFYNTFSFSIPKTYVSDEYLQELISTNNIAFQLSNPYSSTIPISITIIAYSDAEWQEVCNALKCEPYILEDNSATAFTNLINYKNNRTLGVNYEKINNLYFREDCDISISKSFPQYPLQLPFDETTTVLAVNYATFEQIYGSMAPIDIGFYVTKNQEQLVALFSGIHYIDLINVNEFRSYKKVDEANKLFYFVIISTMLIFLTFNMLIVFILRGKYNAHEYRNMHILGISHRHINKMLAFEIIYSILPSFIISNILNHIISYFYLIILSETQKDVSFPFVSISISNIVMILIAVIVFIIIKKELIKCINLNKE